MVKAAYYIPDFTVLELLGIYHSIISSCQLT